jgi:hypothetical protein
MLDWFVLLTPLAVLPLTLLFVFVGCTNDYGALEVLDELILTLHYTGGFAADIASIEVTYTIHQDGREDHSTSATFAYDAMGGFWAEPSWNEPGIETTVTCECALLEKVGLADETPPPPILPDGSPLTRTKGDGNGVDFFLSHQDDGYVLT